FKLVAVSDRLFERIHKALLELIVSQAIPARHEQILSCNTAQVVTLNEDEKIVGQRLHFDSLFSKEVFRKAALRLPIAQEKDAFALPVATHAAQLLYWRAILVIAALSRSLCYEGKHVGKQLLSCRLERDSHRKSGL